MNLVDIPNLLHFSKELMQSGYLPKLQARKLARDCKVYADKCEGQLGYERAQEAIKEYSYWLHEVV